jgi:hypothetical protein
MEQIMAKVTKPFASYAYTWYGKQVYIGFLPKVVVLYGLIENQTFDRTTVEGYQSLASMIEAAVHYQEGLVDKGMLKDSLNNLFDNYCISEGDFRTISDVAASCDCYADAFAKKLAAPHLFLDSYLVSSLEYRKHRPELLRTCECLFDFYENFDEAKLLF